MASAKLSNNKRPPATLRERSRLETAARWPTRAAGLGERTRIHCTREPPARFRPSRLETAASWPTRATVRERKGIQLGVYGIGWPNFKGRTLRRQAGCAEYDPGCLQAMIGAATDVSVCRVRPEGALVRPAQGIALGNRSRSRFFGPTGQRFSRRTIGPLGRKTEIGAILTDDLPSPQGVALGWANWWAFGPKTG